jgi:LacI family transcriptional regulator
VVWPRIRELGLEPDHYATWGAFDYQSGYEQARTLLGRNPRPTAIFASSDQQAIGALRACADLDVAVPAEMSIVGFDDIPLAALVTPRLTTVAQPIERIGERAVALLLARAAEPQRAPRQELLATTLRVRDSCARPRGRAAGTDEVRRA